MRFFLWLNRRALSRSYRDAMEESSWRTTSKSLDLVLRFARKCIRTQRCSKAIDDYDEMNRKYSRMDLEQFGMRHRSAIKLISHMPDSRALVVSQDGPISAVWFDRGRVVVRKGVNLVNMNMLGA